MACGRPFGVEIAGGAPSVAPTPDLRKVPDCPHNAPKPDKGGGREMKRVVEFSVLRAAARPASRS